MSPIPRLPPVTTALLPDRPNKSMVAPVLTGAAASAAAGGSVRDPPARARVAPGKQPARYAMTSFAPAAGARGRCRRCRRGRARQLSGAAQLTPEELEDQRPFEGPLLVVGRRAVAALDVLVVAHVVAGLGHPRHHLAGVP